jgi:uncharacterized damage-inducible protein DinB
VLPLVALRNFFTYNYWARDRQLEACARLDQEQLENSSSTSFASLRHTFAHMVSSEWVWLERLHGDTLSSSPADAEFLTLTNLIARWRVVEHGIRDYLLSLREAGLYRHLSYTDGSGRRWKYPVWLVLMHLANQQTYQRGQVASLLRQLRVQPPAVDLLVADDVGLFGRAVQNEALALAAADC